MDVAHKYETSLKIEKPLRPNKTSPNPGGMRVMDYSSFIVIGRKTGKKIGGGGSSSRRSLPNPIKRGGRNYMEDECVSFSKW